jgi:hypothetical protein
LQGGLEKSRVKLQGDFDQWYKLMCHKADTGTLNYLPPIANTQAQEKAQEKAVPPRAWGTPPADGGAMRPPLSSDGYAAVAPPKAPEGGPVLTGNKEADDDIMAFYKAKQELMSRSKRK